MSTANLGQRLNGLFGYIRQGKIVEAMNEFYEKDTVMQDNANSPTRPVLRRPVTVPLSALIVFR